MRANNFMKRPEGLRDDDETKPRQRLHAKNSLLSLRAVRPFRKHVDEGPIGQSTRCHVEAKVQREYSKVHEATLSSCEWFPPALR